MPPDSTAPMSRHIGVEPFHTDYGAGYQAAGAAQDLVCDWVEDEGFAVHSPVAVGPPQRIAFVDGTMCTEARLTYTDHQGNVRPGLAGSWATGAVLAESGASTRIECAEVKRITVFGGGSSIQLPAHEDGWSWDACATEDEEPDAVRAYLQRRMRDAEGRVAEGLCEKG